MGITFDINNLIKEDAIEVQRLVQNDGMGYLQAIQTVKDYRPCYQQKDDNLIKISNNIIAENEGLDNLEIYDLVTGVTIRDLREDY